MEHVAVAAGAVRRARVARVNPQRDAIGSARPAISPEALISRQPGIGTGALAPRCLPGEVTALPLSQEREATVPSLPTLAPASLPIREPGLFVRCVAAFFKNVDYLRIRSNRSLTSDRTRAEYLGHGDYDRLIDCALQHRLIPHDLDQNGRSAAEEAGALGQTF